MTEVKTRAIEVYVEDRLKAWGREFALNREFEPNGHTVLWLLIKYGGEIPRLEGGPAPDSVDELAYQIERIIADMHKLYPLRAGVMRAYYCGSGRHKFERRQQAKELAGVGHLSAQRYFAEHDAGVAWVMGVLTWD